MKNCLGFLFSDESSCYLSDNLREKIHSHYKIG